MKPKRLTKAEALKICFELWTWLYEHPRVADKLSWPGWKEVYKTYGDVFWAECPCCEWVNRMKYYVNGHCDVLDCSRCPLIKLWPLGCSESQSVTYVIKKSPWLKWAHAEGKGSLKIRKEAAKEIANAALNEYYKLIKVQINKEK